MRLYVGQLGNISHFFFTFHMTQLMTHVVHHGTVVTTVTVSERNGCVMMKMTVVMIVMKNLVVSVSLDF